MIEIKGKAGIVAKVLCDSISEAGNRLITYELEYPRLVHSELLTHGMLVRNAASSRAIPFNKMLKQLTARPVRFGKNQPGMQDDGKDHNEIVEMSWPDSRGEYIVGYNPLEAWEKAKQSAIKFAEAFHRSGYHKQITGRITEPFQMMKVVLSGTELENFFWLRNNGAADPTLEELAKVMHEAREKSVPVLLKPGEWHLPYVDTYKYCDGTPGIWYGIFDESDQIVEITLEQAIKVSASRCAAVSFRNEDYGLEKCLEVYDRLVGDERKHASAFQHQATPMKKTFWSLSDAMSDEDWEDGVSHMDREGNLWSAQFKGWIMNRKLIPGENYTGNT